MTATNGHPDIRRVLERADQKLARQAGDDPLPPDHITGLARAVQTQLAQFKERPETLNPAGESSRFVALQDQLEAQQRELEQLGRQHADTLEENLQLREQLEAGSDVDHARRADFDAVLAERDKLREQVAAALKAGRPRHEPRPPHEHRYPQPEPDELPGPCECGKPFPRLLVDVDEDDDPGLTGWDQQWADLLDELRASGWPHTDDGADTADVAEPTPEQWPHLYPPGDERHMHDTDAAGNCRNRECVYNSDADYFGDYTPPAVKPKRNGRKVAQCGTESGYKRHRANDEDACTDCKKAVTRAQADRKARKASERAS